jgi:hypothetical protein
LFGSEGFMTDNITVVGVRTGVRDHMVKLEAREWEGPWNGEESTLFFYNNPFSRDLPKVP